MARLTDEQLKELSGFLGGNWYDRSEDDETIIKEYIKTENTEIIERTNTLITKFLRSDLPLKEKVHIIKDSAWRKFPDKDADVVKWLEKIQVMLKNYKA